ncbi:MAG: HU family DNA-binding protein [Bacteroidaceae bacterium]|nr:HU family DNA-binding protein [Bacteroidaceae bacterium]
MAINYAVVLVKNPKTEKLEARARAVTKAVEIDDVCTAIAAETTISPADVVGCVKALVDVVSRMIKEGKLVHLGDLGSFYPSLKSDASTEPDTFNTAMIRSVNLRFRPTKSIKDELQDASFERTITKKDRAAQAKASISAINAKLTEQMEEEGE